MAQVPTGSTFFIASAFSAAKTVISVSNAAEAVVGSTAHGFSAADTVEITSGWGRLNGRAFRIKTVTTDSFVLEGCDTTNTTFFPAGSGIGSVRKVNTLTQITQVMNPTSSGGDAKTVTYKYIESDVEGSINDGFSATSYTVDLDADSIGTAGYTALKALTDVQTATILKIITRGGSILLVPCKVTLNEAVQFQDGQINRVKCAFNGNGLGTRYAA